MIKGGIIPGNIASYHTTKNNFGRDRSEKREAMKESKQRANKIARLMALSETQLLSTINGPVAEGTPLYEVILTRIHEYKILTYFRVINGKAFVYAFPNNIQGRLKYYMVKYDLLWSLIEWSRK